MKKLAEKFKKLPKESKQHFWKQVLKLDFEVSQAISANDVPTLKQLTVFLLGIDEYRIIKRNLLKEVIDELK